MNKKGILIAIIILVVVIVLIVAMTGEKKEPNLNQGDTNNNKGTETFDPTIPDEDIELTEPSTEIKAGPDTTASLRIFEVTANKDGYSLDQIVVNKGDTVSIKLVGSDSGFDMMLSDLGLHQTVSAGQEKRLEFQALNPGTFTYTCQSVCPGGKDIKGSLIVKNK